MLYFSNSVYLIYLFEGNLNMELQQLPALCSVYVLKIHIATSPPTSDPVDFLYIRIFLVFNAAAFKFDLLGIIPLGNILLGNPWLRYQLPKN